MKAHLSDEQLMELLALERQSEPPEHLAECAECSAEMELLRAALGGFGAAVRDGAARPEGFWARQRRAIRARLERGGARTRRLAWAGAMALLVLIAVVLHFQSRPGQLATAYDPDDALLVDVARTVRSEVPSALQPAALLSWEMDQAAQATEKSLKAQTGADERR